MISGFCSRGSYTGVPVGSVRFNTSFYFMDIKGLEKGVNYVG